MSAELIETIEKQDLDRLARLLADGADPNDPDPRHPEWIPLKSAIEEISEGGSINAVALLLRYGAAVDGTTPQPCATPLLFAVLNKQLEAARMLLAAGADPSVRDEEGDSPLRMSVVQEDISMAALLLLFGAHRTIHTSWDPFSGMNALGQAVYRLNIPMIELLLKYGADPDEPDMDRQTAIEHLPRWEEANLHPPQLWDQVTELLKRHSRRDD